MHHQNTKITWGTYAKQNQGILLHELFKKVEEEVSKCIPLEAIALTGEYKQMSGVIRPSIDNKSIESDRFDDVDLLRDVLAGRRELSKVATRIPEIAKINLEFMREKFPNCPDDYWDRIERFDEIQKQTFEPTYQMYRYRVEAYQLIGLVPKGIDIFKWKEESKEKRKAMLEELKEFYGVNKLLELKALRKKYFIARKEGESLVKDFKLLKEMKSYEAISEGKVLVRHMLEAIKKHKPKGKDLEKFTNYVDNVEKIMKENSEPNKIDEAIAVMEKTYSRENSNPILFRYYENIRIAKEDKKVIQIKKTTA